jgi:hypothetical protein
MKKYKFWEQPILKVNQEKKLFNELTEDQKYEAVLNKLHSKEKFLRGQDQETSAKNLSDIESLKNTYMNPNFKATMEYFNAVPKKQKFLSSNSNETVSVSVSENSKEELNLDHSNELISIPNLKVNEKLKIKLILVEQNKKESGKNMRKFLSPFLSTFHVGNTKMGIIHTALAIGNKNLNLSIRSVVS